VHEQFFPTYFSRRRDLEEKKTKKGGAASAAKQLTERVSSSSSSSSSSYAYARGCGCCCGCGCGSGYDVLQLELGARFSPEELCVWLGLWLWLSGLVVVSCKVWVWGFVAGRRRAIGPCALN
jgi:hypothetical protein